MHNIMRRAALGLLTAAIAVTAAFATAGAAGATTAAPAAPAHSAALKWPVTGPGSTGQRVVAIQFLLNAQIKAGLTADGIYGAKTTAAVKAFQKKAKLPVDGVVGPMTYPKLIITVKKGQTSDAVAAVNSNLKFSYGFKNLSVGTFFGAKLFAAVESFQKKFKITVDGIVGPTTWNTLIVNEK
jgi:peptidoglycan hydrolase-like protein with peptidoglycan-binding domain